MSSTLEQAAADLKTADAYVDLFEQRTGKKTTDGLRRMLRDAVMAGIKHGRETSSPSSSSQFADLLAGYNRGRKL